MHIAADSWIAICAVLISHVNGYYCLWLPFHHFIHVVDVYLQFIIQLLFYVHLFICVNRVGLWIDTNDSSTKKKEAHTKWLRSIWKQINKYKQLTNRCAIFSVFSNDFEYIYFHCHFIWEKNRKEIINQILIESKWCANF